MTQAATPGLIRSLNLRAVFELVHAAGPLTHPEVVQQTGLSKPTVSELLAQLTDRGLIRGAGRTSGMRGPTAQLYDVEPRAGWVLCLDIGREWLRSTLTDLTGAALGHQAVRTSTGGPQEVITQLRGTARRLADEAGIGVEEVTQVVVGTPGVIRPGEDHFSLAPMLAGWESADVIGGIRRALGVPVVFENDANLAALGELSGGSAQGRRDFVLLWLGTGVGMGVILDGALRRGASGLAGEVGYLPLQRTSEDGTRMVTPPAWGAGAFERQVSAGAIVELAASLGMHDPRSPERVFAAARDGDAIALESVDRVARRLATAIAAVASVLDPELVVIGGGVGSGGGDLLLAPIAEWLPTISPFSPQLSVSTLGVEAVLVGARSVGLSLALDGLLGDTGLPSPAALFRQPAVIGPPAQRGPRSDRVVVEPVAAPSTSDRPGS